MLLLAPAVANVSLRILGVFGSHLTVHNVLSDSVCVATHSLRSTLQTLALPSYALVKSVSRCFISELRTTNPLSKYSPVGLQSRLMIQLPLPVRLATCSPFFTSYSAINFASPAAARNLDAGEKATVLTGLISPCNECASRPVLLLKR